MLFEKNNLFRLTLSLLFIGLVGASFGCAPDLKDDDNQDTNQDVGGDKVTTTDEEDHTLFLVDSSDIDNWVYVDLINGVEVDDAESTDWHLAFKDFGIIVNGGVSGPGQVGVQILNEEDFDALTQAPDGTYFTDVEGETTDRGQNPGRVFDSENNWYSYDFSTHTISARDRVYVLHLDDENFVKLQLITYYDEHGSPGFMQFKVGTVAPPEGDYEVDGLPAGEAGKVTSIEIGDSTLFIVDATNRDEWVYVDLLGADEVTDADSTDWHIAFKSFQVMLNGGASGPGEVAAQILLEEDYDALTQAPDGVYYEDAEAETSPHGQNPGRVFDAEDQWYEYSGPPTHEVAPRDRVYVLHLDGETFVKLQMVGFYDRDENMGYPNFKIAEIDAPEGAYEVQPLPVD